MAQAWWRWVAAAAGAAALAFGTGRPATAQAGGEKPPADKPAEKPADKPEDKPAEPAAPPNLELAKKLLKEAEGLYKKEKDEEALKKAEEAVSADGTWPRAHYFRAEVLLLLGRVNDAETGFRKAIELDPKFVLAWDSLGVAMIAKSSFIQAQECFQKAVDLDKKNAGAHLHLGMMLKRQQKLAEAEKEFLQSAQLDPKFPGSRRELGYLYLVQGKPADAGKQFQMVTRLDPQDYDSWFAYAYCLDVEKKGSEAEDAYRLLLKLNPKYADAWRNLGILYERNESKKNFEEALGFYKKYVECGGKDPAVKSWIAALEEKLKDPKAK